MRLQMSRENKPGGPAQLSHPDGSPDIAAYSRIAHHEREAAIVSSIEGAVSFARTVFSWCAAVLTGKSGSAKHQPHHVR
jgi:hypothetical protein